MSYLDSLLSDDRWEGWYLSKDCISVIRLTRSEMDTLCPHKSSVDYRVYCVNTGEPEYSGIYCYPTNGTIRSLHREIGSEADGIRFGYIMCNLEGIMADCFEQAYIESNKEELERANRMIEHHFI